MGKPSDGATSTNEPWSGVAPYLTGSKATTRTNTTAGSFDEFGQWIPGQTTESNSGQDIPGLFDLGLNTYQSGLWSPVQQSAADSEINRLNNFSTTPYTDVGNNLINGAYNSVINPVSAIPNPNQLSASYINSPAQITQSPYSASTVANPSLITQSPYSAATIKNADKIYAQRINAANEMKNLGIANPDKAIQQMLTGQANTDTLDPVVQAALRRMSESFGEGVMPMLNTNAAVSGQVGGSRQGIAQGLAAKGLANAMGDTSAGMYNDAYNAAQQNMYGTANNMAGLGVDVGKSNAANNLSAQIQNAQNQLATQIANQNALNNASQFNSNQNFAAQNNNILNAMNTGQFNAGALNNAGQFNSNQNLAAQGTNILNAMNAGQFNANQDYTAQAQNADNQMSTNLNNANLGLSNNTQFMANNTQNAQNAISGLSALGTGNTLDANNYAALQAALASPSMYNQNALNQYANILQPGMNFNQTSDGQSGLANALGGAAAGYGIGTNLIAPLLGATGPGVAGWGAVGGLGGLLLSDIRAKTDIRRVGSTDKGIPVYVYRYKSGGPMQMGVMAHEAEKIVPEAVGYIGDGDLKGVDYAKL